MTKAAQGRGKPREEEEEDTQGKAGEGEAEEDDDDTDGAWIAELERWRADEATDGQSARLILFRRRPPPDRGKERVWQWEDEEIPDKHGIGLLYGGGRYTTWLMLPPKGGRGKGRIRTNTFMLAESYTEAKRARERAEALSGPPAAAGGQVVAQGPNPMEMMAWTMREIVGPFLAMMREERQARPVAAAPANPFEHFKGFSETMNTVLTQNAKAQIELVRDINREIALGKSNAPATQPAEGEEEASDGEFKDFIKDMIKEYGPTLLDATGLRLKAIKPIIQGNEVFQALTANKSLLERVTALLFQDPQVNKDEATKVLDKLSKMGIGVLVKPKPAAPAAAAVATSTPAAAR